MKKLKFIKKRNYFNKVNEEKVRIKDSFEINTKANNKNMKKSKNLSRAISDISIHKYLNLFFLLILIIEAIYLIILFSLKSKSNQVSSSKKEQKVPRIKFQNISREKALDIAKEYVEICQEGLLINKREFIKSKEPLVSVIIPVYNSENAIKATVRSIQNQNMIDIEIILVNDSPTDNTTNIIQELQLEDPRIKIIYNNKSMGTLYSRSVGVLEAKGKYITCLDHDDLFIDKDLFDMIYEETNEEYFDIVSFKAFDTHNLKVFEDDYLADNKNSKTLYQPELGIFSFRRSEPLFHNNILVWGKFIRTNVYKAAVNLMGKKRYSIYLLWCEDTSIFFIICSIAQSYKFVEKFGILHFLYKKSGSLMLPNDHLIFGDVFLVDIIFDFSKNEYKKNAIYKLIEARHRGYFSVSKANDTVKTYLKQVVKKIINCEYIGENDKKKLKNNFKGHEELFNESSRI